MTVRASGPLVTDDAEASVEAAVQGLEIMQSTDWFGGRQLANGRLVPVLDNWTLEGERTVYAVVPSNHLLAARTRAFRLDHGSLFACSAPAQMERTALSRPGTLECSIRIQAA